MDFPDIGKVYGDTDNFRSKPLRALIPQEQGCIDEINVRAECLQVMILSLPPSRERSTAITHLEDAVMWAVKAVTA